MTKTGILLVALIAAIALGGGAMAQEGTAQFLPASATMGGKAVDANHANTTASGTYAVQAMSYDVGSVTGSDGGAGR